MKIFLKKILRKWRYSLVGLIIVLKEEKSIWAYLGLYLTIILIGVGLKFSLLEWAIIVGGIFGTLAIEIINTALEAAVDAISFQYNIKVKKIKDIAAGATLVITVGTIISWIIIIADKVLQLI